METKNKFFNPKNQISKKIDHVDFIKDYELLLNKSENAVIVKTEWHRKGDYFEKLSLYDASYSTVLTFGHTTLIK